MQDIAAPAPRPHQVTISRAALQRGSGVRCLGTAVKAEPRLGPQDAANPQQFMPSKAASAAALQSTFGAS
jgi:hypothetical protein